MERLPPNYGDHRPTLWRGHSSPADVRSASMDSRLTVTESFAREIAAALAASSGAWTGCDWPTQFGRNHLNLKGLRSSQALLMERATSGSEGADWRDAVAWLRRVEQDARQAESEARVAVRLAGCGRLLEALECAKRACAIEARYRKPPTWESLKDVIEAALSTGEGDTNPPGGSP